MDDVMRLTASQILAIPETEPERLFITPDQIKPRFKTLARRWHPDAATGDENVFKHVSILHDKAVDAAESDLWHTPGAFEFVRKDGKRFVLRYFKTFAFELGQAYLSDTMVTYVINPEFADLAENAKTTIAGFRFPDDETRKVMTLYLPVLKGYHETKTGNVVIMIDKPSDLVRMRDLVDHLGKIDPKHAAWMISRMLNHISYLEWAELTHNDFSLDTLFVCPEHHTVCVLGGWWYAKRAGEKLSALSQRTINNAPNEVIRTKLAATSTDGALVRLTGRELLGDANGMHLAMDKSLPPPMVNWLRLASTGESKKDYKEWREKILMGSYGPRKFVKMPTRSQDVYHP